jgi:hypothetical protein
MRTALLLSLSLAAAGCSLTIDPESVKPPDGSCVPSGCAGKACGFDDCGTICRPGSGCVETHRMSGRLVNGAQRSAAAGGHSIEGGLGTAGQPAAPAGHRVAGGVVSQ